MGETSVCEGTPPQFLTGPSETPWTACVSYISTGWHSAILILFRYWLVRNSFVKKQEGKRKRTTCHKLPKKKKKKVEKKVR